MILKKSLRRHLFVDPKVQGTFVVRAILYWVAFLITAALLLLCWRILTGPARMFYTHFNDMWFFYGPAIVASMLLLPLVVIDIVRVSNRLVGPMVRLRRSMRELARGEHVEPITFREGDFWQQFAEEFNSVVARVQSETDTAEPETERREEPISVGAK